MQQFFVEVSVETPSLTVINRIPAKNWAECLQSARELTTTMFYEDPMAQRVFHNGIYRFRGVNDLGDTVQVVPVCQTEADRFVDVSGDCPESDCAIRDVCRN